jgi:hypothetical protein
LDSSYITVTATFLALLLGDTVGKSWHDDAAERSGNVHEDGDVLQLCDAEQSSTKFAKRCSLSI